MENIKKFQNFILVSHMGIDGANFLICCLSISDYIYFDGMKKKDKIVYFFSNLKNIENEWKDVGMWFPTFFKDIHINHVVDKNIIVKIHNYQLDKFLDNFSRQKHLIILENPLLFRSLRQIAQDCEIFDTDTKMKWYEIEKNIFLNRINIEYYNLLDENKKIELERKMKYKVFDESSLKNKVDNIHIWDVNWFLNEKNTISNIKKIYEKIGFLDYDENIIKIMYRKWIEKINLVKNNRIKC